MSTPFRTAIAKLSATMACGRDEMLHILNLAQGDANRTASQKETMKSLIADFTIYSDSFMAKLDQQIIATDADRTLRINRVRNDLRSSKDGSSEFQNAKSPEEGEES